MSTVKPTSPPQSLVLMKQDCESQQSLLGPPKLQPMVERRNPHNAQPVKSEPLTPATSTTVFDYPYEFCVPGDELTLQSNGRALKRHHSPSMPGTDHSPPHHHHHHAHAHAHSRVTSSALVSPAQSSSVMSVPYQPSAMSFYEDLNSFKQSSRSSLPPSMTSAGMERHRSSEAAVAVTADLGPFAHRTIQPRNSSIYFESSIAPASSSTSPSVDAPSSVSVSAPGFTTPESAFYQYQNRMEAQLCQVCGESAAGFHHGAYVCEACKKFFMRHSLTDAKLASTCPTGGKCPITKGSRGKCQQCRYKKCIEIGMYLKDPDIQSDVDISSIPCRVCGGRSSGFHFGALTCEGCKGFFRRTEGSAARLVCSGGQDNCAITPRSRNACKSCRFQRCLAVGMSKVGSRIGRQPNAVKFHCALEIKKMQVMRDILSAPQNSDMHSSENAVAAAAAAARTVSPTKSKPMHNSDLGGSAAGLLEAVVMGAIKKRVSVTSSSGNPTPLSNGFASLDVPQRKCTFDHLRMVQGQNKTSPPAVAVSVSMLDSSSQMQNDLPAALTSILPVSPANSSSSATGSGVTPLTEAIDRFANGMRTATEFLRMPNTYFKSRFQMSSIPAEHCGNISLVWDHMMNHFHMHAQQVVQFAKLIPGFNQFSLPTRSALVREGMYSVLLLLLSRDFQPDTDHFNYFDFSSEERAVIMHHFSSFRRIEEHLRISGRLANKLKFSLQELSISCAIEILRNYYIVDDSENSNVQSLYLLARNSLMKCMSASAEGSEEQAKARWVNVEALSEMLASMNKEHHQILTDLKSTRRDLQFPELYVEMFQLADDAAALVSAAVVAYCRNNSSAQLPGSSTELLRASPDVNLVLDVGGKSSAQNRNSFSVDVSKSLQPPPTSMFNILNYQSSIEEATQDSASTEQDAKAQISSPF